MRKTELERNHRGVYGTISDANRGINASGHNAPENVYWEYSAGIKSSKCFVSILPGEEII
jgi:hypothetical protein